MCRRAKKKKRRTRSSSREVDIDDKVEAAPPASAPEYDALEEEADAPPEPDETLVDADLGGPPDLRDEPSDEDTEGARLAADLERTQAAPDDIGGDVEVAGTGAADLVERVRLHRPRVPAAAGRLDRRRTPRAAAPSLERDASHGSRPSRRGDGGGSLLASARSRDAGRAPSRGGDESESDGAGDSVATRAPTGALPQPTAGAALQVATPVPTAARPTPAPTVRPTTRAARPAPTAAPRAPAARRGRSRGRDGSSGRTAIRRAPIPIARLASAFSSSSPARSRR